MKARRPEVSWDILLSTTGLSFSSTKTATWVTKPKSSPRGWTARGSVCTRLAVRTGPTLWAWLLQSWTKLLVCIDDIHTHTHIVDCWFKMAPLFHSDPPNYIMFHPWPHFQKYRFTWLFILTLVWWAVTPENKLFAYKQLKSIFSLMSGQIEILCIDLYLLHF